MAKALRDGDLEHAPITQAERLLLEFVGTLTKHAYRITDEQVQTLRDVGWTDTLIAEAVYEGARYNMLVWIAEAFDIHPPASWQPIMEPEGVPAVITRD